MPIEWIEKLKTRWQVTSMFQVVVILIVFACTGFTVLFIKPLVVDFFFDGEDMTGWSQVGYYVTLPFFYNILLLIYGTLFGQYTFFWNFEKNFFSRFYFLFRNKK